MTREKRKASGRVVPRSKRREAQRQERAEQRRWRDAISIHPAAELLPEPTDDEKKALAVDIAEQGQLEPVRLTPEGQLLDGRSRLDAMERIGVQTVTAAGTLAAAVKSVTEEGDPYDIVLSLNVRRRHLTTAQKRRAAVELLRERPERSDRLTGKLAGVDHKTVARLRRELEGTGEIPQLDERVGEDEKTRRDGKGRPPKPKVKDKSSKPLPVNVGERVRELAKTGDDPATIGRTLHEEIPAITVVTSDVKRLLLPDSKLEDIDFDALAHWIRAVEFDSALAVVGDIAPLR